MKKNKKIYNLFKILLIVFVFLTFFSRPQSSFATAGWLSDYSYRKQITISNTNVDSDLAYFPLLVSSTGDSDIGTKVINADNGYDIRFTDSDGTTLLPYEKEKFLITNGSASFNFWVRVPVITHLSPTVIYLYYGNTSANTDWTAETSSITNCTSITNAQCVWKEGTSQNFQMVQHLPNGSVLTANDSIASGHNGTLSGVTPPNAMPGKIDGAANFDGNTSYIDFANTSGVIDNLSKMTVSYWIAGYQSFPYSTVIAKIGDYMGTAGWWSGLISMAGSHYSFMVQGAGGNTWDQKSTTLILDNNLHNVVSTYDYATHSILIYIDGVSQTSFYQTHKNLASSYSYPSNVQIGKVAVDGTQKYYNGLVDEVRISSNVRSADWIKFEYNNINSADNELTFSTQEPPTISSASFFDTDSDGKLDKISVLWSTNINPVVDGTADWTISSVANFSDLVEGTVFCNSETARANECIYNFTTSTSKTDVGDLTLTYNGTSITNGTSNATVKTISSSSSPSFIDSALPIITQVTAVISPTNDTTPNFTFDTTEPGNITYGGSCVSNTTSASFGHNTITFNSLVDGTYNNCTITMSDQTNNLSATLPINTFSVDTIPPIITLVGPSVINLFVNSTYQDQGATATDNIDGDITGNIVISNNVNTANSGTYIITYRVNDFAGNYATGVIRTINVNIKPSHGYLIKPKTIILNNIPSENLTSITNKYTFSKILKLNAINNEVRELQKFLNTHGYPIVKTKKGQAIQAGSLGYETTKFGVLTKKALMKFQKENKLIPDGIFGPSTQKVINALLK